MSRLTSPEHYIALLNKYDTWMFDCDGVLWNGERVLDGVVDVLSMLRKKQKTIIFVTNNATKSRKTYKKKFDQLGIQARVDEIYGSAYASAIYLSSVVKLQRNKKVYVIGQAGLEEELREEGISFIGGTDPADNTLAPFSLSKFSPDPEVAAVLFGLDTAINYTKLSKAFQYLTRDPKCLFLATNLDSTYPDAGGILPGAGAIVAPLRLMLGRDPINIGKPASTMLDCIKAKVQFEPSRTLMIGDRLNTDILFGQGGGLSTLLVLTGITTEGDINGPGASPIVPDFVTPSLGDFLCVCEKWLDHSNV